MFKKSFMALGLFGAAMASQAADVQVYGVLDAGLDYNNSKISSAVTMGPSTDRLKLNSSPTKLASGIHSGNRLGIKGTEKIGDSLKAGFVLESGFDLLNGDLAEKGRLFSRQADLFVEGGFGHLAVGRFGTLTSGTGSYGILGNITDNFGGGWGQSIGAAKHVFASSGRIDNAVTYATPELAGIQLFAQYSFSRNEDQKAKARENDRYAALGATYKRNNLALVGVFDKTFYKNGKIVYDKANYEKPSVIDDRWTLNLGGSYDFEAVKVYALYQHAAHAMDFGMLNGTKIFTLSRDAGPDALDLVKSLTKLQRFENYYDNLDSRRFDMMINQANGIKSDSIALGLDAPIGNGVLKAQFHYGRGKFERPYDGTSFIKGFNTKMRSTGIALGYEYNLGKHTQLYAAAAYDKTRVNMNIAKLMNLFSDVKTKVDMKTFEAVAGLVHKF